MHLTQAHAALLHNKRAHDAVSRHYEKIHGEIYNPIEQHRLHQKLQQAALQIKTRSKQQQALDLGCGSGNITRHLLELGFTVTAADISQKFLDLVKKLYGKTKKVQTRLLNGIDLSNFSDDAYDLTATYSVLHHIPDYLAFVREMVRVTKPGGIIYLDHEHSASYWKKSKAYLSFLQEQLQPHKSWKRFFKPASYYHKIRSIMNPRYQPEGDVHVWQDDHIEWQKIERLLKQQGCEIIEKTDYLLYQRGFDLGSYFFYQDNCQDMTVLVARKNR